MLTIPRSIYKSSTKDLSLPTFEIAMEYDARPKPIVMRVTSGEVTEGTQSVLQSRLDLSIKPRALALFANSVE